MHPFVNNPIIVIIFNSIGSFCISCVYSSSSSTTSYSPYLNWNFFYSFWIVGSFLLVAVTVVIMCLCVYLILDSVRLVTHWGLSYTRCCLIFKPILHLKCAYTFTLKEAEYQFTKEFLFIIFLMCSILLLLPSKKKMIARFIW